MSVKALLTPHYSENDGILLLLHLVKKILLYPPKKLAKCDEHVLFETSGSTQNKGQKLQLSDLFDFPKIEKNFHSEQIQYLFFCFIKINKDSQNTKQNPNIQTVTTKQTTIIDKYLLFQKEELKSQEMTQKENRGGREKQLFNSKKYNIFHTGSTSTCKSIPLACACA